MGLIDDGKGVAEDAIGVKIDPGVAETVGWMGKTGGTKDREWPSLGVVGGDESISISTTSLSIGICGVSGIDAGNGRSEKVGGGGGGGGGGGFLFGCGVGRDPLG